MGTKVPSAPIVPVQSHVGHGALGLRSWLRDIDQLFDATDATPQLFAEIRLGIAITTGWAADSGVYRVPFYYTHDGVPFDIVAVTTSLQALTRVESVAQCAATAGSYYYDPVSGPSYRWDGGTGADVWDGGGTWDTGAFLYVNATAAEIAALISARIGVFVGSDAVTQPVLGPDILNAPTGFVNDANSTNFATTRVYQGNAPVALRNFTGGGSYYRKDGLAVIQGGLYVLTGAYIVDNGGLGIQVSTSGADTGIVQADGRNTSNAAPTVRNDFEAASISVDDTNIWPWRRFCFYFLAPVSTLRVAFTMPPAGKWTIADLRLHRVHRWVRYQPQLDAYSDLSISEGREDTYFSRWHVGASSVTLDNDGSHETLFGKYDSLGAEIIMRRGGMFPNGGEEITAEAMRIGFWGRVVDVDVGEQATVLDLEDTHGQFNEEIPKRTYDQETFPGCDPRIVGVENDIDESKGGRKRPMFWGYQEDMVPNRIAITDADLGRYEVADTTDWPAGIAVSDGVTGRFAEARLFKDEDSAQRNDLTQSIALDNQHINWNAVAGRFDAISCIKPVPVDEEHLYYSFKVNGGSQLDARILAGTEELLNLTLNANGADNSFSPIGAPTLWEAVQFIDGAWGDSTSTSSIRRCEVTAAAISGSASIDYAQMAVRVRAVNGVFEDGDTLKLYVNRGGTRYYGPTYKELGAEAFVEITHTWLPADVGLSAWTESDINGLSWGVEYDPNGADRIYCDLIQPRVFRFKSAQPSASNPSIHTPRQHAKALQQAMLTVASLSTGIVVTWSDVTFTWTVTADGVTVTSIELMTKDGRQKSGWPMMLFRTDQNETGALTYTSSAPYYVPDADIDLPVLRVKAVGYIDDSSGSYTGVASRPIEKGPDVLRFVLRRLLFVDAARINNASFDTVRAVAKVLAVYLGSATALQELVNRIETSDQADLVVDGDRYYYSARASSWAANGVQLYDRDFIGGVKSGFAASELYGVVRLLFAQKPALGRWETREILTTARTRYGRGDSREFVTYLANSGDAATVHAIIAAQAATTKRRYSLTVRGQLQRVRPGQVIRINPVKGGLSNAAGSVSPVDVRLVTRDTNDLEGTSTATLVEV